MTLETALLSALTTVTSALVWAVQVLYARLQKAESTVEELRQLIEGLNRENGEHAAKVEMYERCPKRLDCPFSLSRTMPQ